MRRPPWTDYCYRRSQLTTTVGKSAEETESGELKLCFEPEITSTRAHVETLSSVAELQSLTSKSPVQSILLGYLAADSQPIGLLVEEDRVVRGDQLAVVVADEGRPRVLADQPADDVRIVPGMERIGAPLPRRPEGIQFGARSTIT